MGNPGFLQFWKDQRQVPPPVVKEDLAGKTVMVIGANTGIGLETVKHLTLMGAARVILGCRNSEKSERALAEVQKLAKADQKVELWHIDLLITSSVIEFADKFKADGGRLDLLICNAAIATYTYTTAVDGTESTLQVNHFSISLISILLLPHLEKTGRENGTNPRLVIVSSDLHYMAHIDPEVLKAPNLLDALSNKAYCTPKRMRERYTLSKLLNVFMARALTDRTGPSSPVIINSINPGYTYSELRRNVTGLRALFFRLMEAVLAWSGEVGARVVLWAALAGKPDEMRGQYVSTWEVREASDFVLSKKGREVQDKVWNETIEKLSVACPEVRTIVQQHFRD